ncbi:MAG TPA: acyltransferase [Marmoricola sp.]|nr:acyltransferase [Marmoricola sp.]
MAKSAVITPLTGVRLVAAVWVVFFHIYLYNGHDLAAAHPAVDAVVGPIVSQGDLGVDLFFLLSGFVLAHNYLERLGPAASLNGTVSFLWLRLAGVWPLYILATVGGGLLLFLRFQVWGTHPSVPLSVWKFVTQVVMVQSWLTGQATTSSWTGPAWTISAEWLAYLCFPALALVVWRLRGRAGPRTLLLLAGLALVPTLVWTTVAETQAAPYMWLARLVSEFTCGALLSAAVHHHLPRLVRAAGWLVPATIVAGAAWLYLAQAVDRPWLGPLVVALFPVLVLGLAHGDGHVHRWLGSRMMVLGGGVSFALYLVHVPLLMLFRDALHHHAIPLDRGHQMYGELAVAVLSLLLAWVLFTRVEEPARHRMRALGPAVVSTVASFRGSRPEPVAPAPVTLEYAAEQQARRVGV